MTTEKKTGLALLREPFEPHQISKLPKPTKKQTEEVRNDFSKGIRCQQCGQWHHKDVVHLDYVGHAALTDRLLQCDDSWNWEPLSTDQNGLPLLDQSGGMWIKLTVCGVTRLGYGDADGKQGGNAVKERIGDALRNAAMRFGAALDLWHKGELHVSDDAQESVVDNKPAAKPASPEQHETDRNRLIAAIDNLGDVQSVEKLYAQSNFKAAIQGIPEAMQADVQKAYTDKLAALA